MRAWAARVAGRGRESFCEQCGAPGVVRTERRVADRPRRDELLTCRGCSLLSCQACWPGPFLACRACCVRQDPVLAAFTDEPPRPPVAPAPARTDDRGRPWRSRPSPVGVIAAAAVVALVVVGSAIALTRPGSGTGGVAGVTVRSTAMPARTPSGTAPGATASAPVPSATVDPVVEPSTPSASPRPGTPANLEITSSEVVPWVDAVGELRAQVLVGVTNAGGTAAYLPSAASAWEVLSPDGFAVSRGRFAHVFPRLVEPGATAWMVDAVSATFVEPGELDEVRVTLDDRPATPADADAAASLTVSDVDWRVDADGRLSVSGLVENAGPEPLARWSAGVILLRADGTPLAAAYEVAEPEALASGATVRFETAYPGSAPIASDDVATVVAVAVPLD